MSRKRRMWLVRMTGGKSVANGGEGVRTQVKVLAKARAELLALLEASTSVPTDALLTAQFFIEDIEQQLKNIGAPPENATVVYTGKSQYWWLYIEGIWLGIRVRETWSGFFRIRTQILTLETAVDSLSRV